MVTEPESGYLTLVERLDEVRYFLMTEWERAADRGWQVRAAHISDLLTAIVDAVEAVRAVQTEGGEG